MKKFSKVTLIICAVAAVLGTVLLTSGMIMGFTTGEISQVLEGKGADFMRRGSFGNNSKGIEISEEFNAADISGLKIEVDYGYVDVSVGTGDEFRITGTASEYFTAQVDRDGILRVEDTGKTFRVIGWRNNWDLALYVTIPQNCQFVSTDFIIGAGEGNALDIRTENLKVEAGAGAFEGRNFEVTRKADLSVGAGKLTLAGSMQADVTAECGVGAISMQLDGVYEDYNYQLDCGIGKISTGDQSYSGLGHESSVNNRAAHDMRLECGVGKIDVKF